MNAAFSSISTARETLPTLMNGYAKPIAKNEYLLMQTLHCSLREIGVDYGTNAVKLSLWCEEVLSSMGATA